jgi:hypothetical protein
MLRQPALHAKGDHVKKTKRLQLSTETVRKLSSSDLAGVVGGTSTLTLVCPPSQPKSQCACPSRACEF